MAKAMREYFHTSDEKNISNLVVGILDFPSVNTYYSVELKEKIF